MRIEEERLTLGGRVVAWVAQTLGCTQGQVYTLATGLILALVLAVAGQH